MPLRTVIRAASVALGLAPIAAWILTNDGWRAGLWAFAILALAMLPAAWVGSRADRLPNGIGAERDQSLAGALVEFPGHKEQLTEAGTVLYFPAGHVVHEPEMPMRDGVASK